jgi:membrane protein
MKLEPPFAPDDDETPRDVSFRGYLDELSSRPVRDSRMDRARTKVLDSAERLTTWGPLGPIAETGWQVWRRDQEIAGSVLAAALAYRVFIWLLPLALVLVAGFGFAGKSGTSHALSDLGVSSYVSQSVSDASHAGSWFGRLVIIVSGTIVFLYETYVLLRTLRAISAFAWHMRVRPMRQPHRQVLYFLGLSLILLVGLVLTNTIARALFFPLGLIIAIASLLLVPAYVVLISMVLLPNRASRWTAFIPGAILVYGTYALVHLLATLVVVPWVAHKQATYGVLGISAGMLFLMFVFGRIIELAFSLNAVMEEQRKSAAEQRQHSGSPA